MSKFIVKEILEKVEGLDVNGQVAPGCYKDCTHTYWAKAYSGKSGCYQKEYYDAITSGAH
ncbi:hypothetical protein [Clostridium oryzae]|uniref:Uncharacterized protein n=1 Tax=Clostridium oryzae TaxID=1450648 RepID=A0A1V4IXP1_9CLOT|nr:hypothetical protein [Clostridium oryzae]OPJ64167.1 hypothetical protein CLORY_07150 [Clostridium oryzae]